MSIKLNSISLPGPLINKIHTDLKIKAKGAKKGAYKARISEMCTYSANKDGDGTYLIPLHYARTYLKLVGLRVPQQIKFAINDNLQFKDDKYCQQKPVFDEALIKLKETGSCFLQLHCGWGKTWMAIAVAAHLGLKTVVLVHRRFLANQFVTEAQNIIPNQIYFLDENTDMSGADKYPIVVIMRQRVSKLPESFTNKIDFMIVDEAKYWCTPEGIASMLRFRPTHTMGLCAERERKDGYHLVLEHFFGHNIFRKSCKPFIVRKYYTSFIPECKRPAYGKAKIDWNIAMQSIAKNEDRNKMIRDICRVRQNNKIMILVQYKEHVETLFKLLQDVGEDVATFYSDADGYSNCRVLIATYSKAEMGFDDKNLCENFDGHRLDLLILGAFYKDEIEQSAGRVMRSDAPEIIDIVDNHSSLMKHSLSRDKFFKSRCGKICDPEFFFPTNIGRKLPAKVQLQG